MRPLSRAAMWLVRDPKRTQTSDRADLGAERRSLAPRNRVFHTADGVAYWAGINAVSYNTVVPLFASKLTDSPLLIGLVAVLSQAGWYLPQLITAAATERVSYKRPIVVRLGFLVERAPALLWPLAALISFSRPGLGLGLFLTAFGLHIFWRRDHSACVARPNRAHLRSDRARPILWDHHLPRDFARRARRVWCKPSTRRLCISV